MRERLIFNGSLRYFLWFAYVLVYVCVFLIRNESNWIPEKLDLLLKCQIVSTLCIPFTLCQWQGSRCKRRKPLLLDSFFAKMYWAVTNTCNAIHCTTFWFEEAEKMLKLNDYLFGRWFSLSFVLFCRRVSAAKHMYIYNKYVELTKVTQLSVQSQNSANSLLCSVMLVRAWLFKFKILRRNTKIRLTVCWAAG